MDGTPGHHEKTVGTTGHHETGHCVTAGPVKRQS